MQLIDNRLQRGIERGKGVEAVSILFVDILVYICFIWGLDAELPLDLMHNICLLISMRLRRGKVKTKEVSTKARSFGLAFGNSSMP